MKAFLATLTLLCMTSVSSAQTSWRDVKVYEFSSMDYPDSLEICGGEWFVKGTASNLSELSRAEWKRIQKKVAKYGCSVVYVDTKKVFSPLSGKLYILGLKPKE